jgi:3-dehydroquinate synthetase
MNNKTKQGLKTDGKAELKKSYRELLKMGMITREQYLKMIELIDKDANITEQAEDKK